MSWRKLETIPSEMISEIHFDSETDRLRITFLSKGKVSGKYEYQNLHTSGAEEAAEALVGLSIIEALESETVSLGDLVWRTIRKSYICPDTYRLVKPDADDYNEECDCEVHPHEIHRWADDGGPHID